MLNHLGPDVILPSIIIHSFSLCFSVYVCVVRSVNSLITMLVLRDASHHAFWVALNHANKAKLIYSIVNSYFVDV